MLTTVAVLATQAIANVVKSSFGPSGLDKMMVDDIGVSACCCPALPTDRNTPLTRRTNRM